MGYWIWTFVVLIAPLLALATAIVLQIVIGQAARNLSIYISMLAALLSGLVLVCLVGIAAHAAGFDNGSRTLVNAAIYFCACYIYFHFNNMGETARRIRLLRELIAADHPLTFNELAGRYGAREIVRRRIDRMIAAKQIIHIDGRYIIADRSVYRMAVLIEIAHAIIFGHRRKNLLEVS